MIGSGSRGSLSSVGWTALGVSQAQELAVAEAGVGSVRLFE